MTVLSKLLFIHICGNRLRDFNVLRENMEFMMKALEQKYDWSHYNQSYYYSIVWFWNSKLHP